MSANRLVAFCLSEKIVMGSGSGAANCRKTQIRIIPVVKYGYLILVALAAIFTARRAQMRTAASGIKYMEYKCGLCVKSSRTYARENGAIRLFFNP